jgi:small subunit ribosomal protein S2
MTKVDVKALLEAGVHFGHRTDRWNPKMKPYIFGARNGIYVIDLIQTAEQLEAACKFVKNISAQGGKTLFVGCKKQCKEFVKDLAEKNSSYYVNERWLGGTLTNLNTIRKSVARMKELDGLEKSGKIHDLPKQEASALRRENQKLHRNLDGIRDMDKVPAMLIVVDPSREVIAVNEARRLKIPIVALNDTNSDPDLVDYPIAGNDDAIRSIKIVLDYLHAAMIEGKGEAPKHKKSSNGDKVEMNAVSA